MLKLGGLAGRVGASVLSSKALDISRSPAEQKRRRIENMTRNAARIVETLGELKGAAMKVGQMVSLNDGLLPPEVTEKLRELQSQAPRVPFDQMERQLQDELPNFADVFESIEPKAFAAASIGQVHKGRLKDGRLVAVKIQYPNIDRIVRADLTNLRRVLKSLFALASDADFDPVWQEVKRRLLEELDYKNEAKESAKMASLCADWPEVVVPKVISHASSQRILTMEFVDGLSADEACSTDISDELRDQWGQTLFEVIGRGILSHGLLHADPNLANFAFREDGRLVIYDFGCVKVVPEALRQGYTRLATAAIEVAPEAIPEILTEMGVIDEAGGPVGRDLTDPYVRLFSEIFRSEPVYRFGEDETVYAKLLELGMENWSQQLDVRFPGDIIFIQRALGGHFANLWRLGSAGPWRDIVEHILERGK